MKKLSLILLAAGVIIAAVLSSGRPAQEGYGVKVTNNPGCPVQIVAVSPQLSQDSTQFQGARVTLQNTGEVPCDAFAVSFILTFNDGEKLSAGWQEDHVPSGYANIDPAADNRIMPNQIYDGDATGMQVSAREPATVVGIEARVDYVEMADGKTYGDDPDKVRDSIHMTRFGHHAERRRLMDIYNTSGIEALLDELRRE